MNISRFAQMMQKGVYDKNADLEHEGEDFQDGFKVGYEENELHGTHAITNEYLLRGGSIDGDEKLVTQEGFMEWKRGYWAGRFTRLVPDRPLEPSTKDGASKPLTIEDDAAEYWKIVRNQPSTKDETVEPRDDIPQAVSQQGGDVK